MTVRSWSLSIPSATLAAAACVGCPDRTTESLPFARAIAERLCAAQTACDCDGAPIPDCDDNVQRLAARWERDAIAAGLSFHQDCLEEFLANLETAAECERSPLFPECRVYGGTADEGEGCRVYSDYSSMMTECRAGLTCMDDGVCEDRRNPPVLQLGDRCSAEPSTFPIGVFGECDAELDCDSLDTLLCVPTRSTIPDGGACTGGPEYCQSSFCRTDDPDVDPSPESPGVCQPRTTLPGEPCTYLNECTTGCELDVGTCFVFPPTMCSVVHSFEIRIDAAASSTE